MHSHPAMRWCRRSASSPEPMQASGTRQCWRWPIAGHTSSWRAGPCSAALPPHRCTRRRDLRHRILLLSPTLMTAHTIASPNAVHAAHRRWRLRSSHCRAARPVAWRSPSWTSTASPACGGAQLLIVPRQWGTIGIALDNSTSSKLVNWCKLQYKQEYALSEKTQYDGPTRMCTPVQTSLPRFVARFAARRLALSLLVCNAGVMGGPRRTTVDGLEMQFQVGSGAEKQWWQG